MTIHTCRTVVLLLVVAVLVPACQTAEAEPNAPGSEAEEIARKYVAAYNAQDVAELGATLGDSLVMNGEEVVSREDFLELVQRYWAMIPDFELRPTHVVGADPYVTVRMDLNGTATGEFLGHDIEGREFTVSETKLLRTSDGEITEYWYNWDELGFLAQLGIVDSPCE